MKFKNDKQRKAVMARMNNGYSRNGSVIITNNPSNKNKTYSQLKILKPNKDDDGDGIKNKQDCKPLDPKKQGFLHDLQIKALKKKEEKLEKRREKEMKKLEDLKDTLKNRQAISDKSNSLKQLQLKQKQALINEINKEKKKGEAIRKANQQAKEQLDKLTITGKSKALAARGALATMRGSKLALKSAIAFSQKKSTKKTLKKIGKFFR